MNSSIYIAFYLGRKKDNPKTSLLDQLICFFTNSRYSHCELVLWYDHKSKIANCWSASPRSNGVRNKKIRLDSHWELYKIDTVLDVKHFEEFFRAQEGKKYDYFGALGVQFPFFKHEPSRWFCSEIIAAAWGISHPYYYSPQDIYDFFVKEVYEQQVETKEVT